MTITIEKKIEETVEITLPAYYSYGASVYKILNEERVIRVIDYDFFTTIEVSNAYRTVIQTVISYGERITEEEFLDKFIQVGESLKRELEKAIESEKWQAQENQLQTVNA